MLPHLSYIYFALSRQILCLSYFMQAEQAWSKVSQFSSASVRAHIRGDLSKLWWQLRLQSKYWYSP